ncbi:phosphatidylserine decarboxylase [Eubacterium multiforme]|uniref:Phosphatidylserine decarboxylase proenzyme n=1 Tax=Eubacterium multiforme TaxID=83339 RepID=A0ABT9UXE3_9FIRM|nr:phosphatidylserine decarboxylase [Eubacterium multiforme]MDQ0150989.1 phosphatidylserine decarboxylase [Eubacterium multiforme]
MILVYNRATKSYDEEKVAGKKYLDWCYESPAGKRITELIIKKRFCSKIYGMYCDSKLSAKKIPKFIHDFNINMNIYSKNASDFKNFNDFFARELRTDARSIPNDNNILMSPVDGRLLAYENIDMNKIVQVKGITYSLSELLGDSKIANEYNDGTCLIFRLCPTDYHRFHFIDSGIPGANHFIKGNYYSVNPVAIDRIPKLFCQNKREWSVFKSDNFDDVLYVEVGATCVGSIIQSYKVGKKVNRGDEKGYFKFGGSTVILFLKKGIINIDEDIIKQTNLGYETKVSMGEDIGIKK